MGKYAMELYKKLDQYDDMDNEVDFPHWWQSKLTKAKSMLQSAYDYLDGEEKITQIDAIMEKEENKLPVNDIKKAIRALLKKEGGAAGLAPILKLAKDFDGVTQIDVEDILDNDMKDVEKHRDGDYILKEEEVKIGPHTFKKIKDDHYHKIDKNGNEKTGRKFRQQEIDYLMKTLKETGLKKSKKNMDDYKRLNELVKAALMGPINEKKKDHDGDGDIDSEDYLIARDKAIKKAKGEKVDESLQPLISKLKKAPEEVGKELAQAFSDETDKLIKLFKGMGFDDKKAKEMANNPGRALGMRSESLAERIFKELRK